jgi:hypothetical protein
MAVNYVPKFVTTSTHDVAEPESKNYPSDTKRKKVTMKTWQSNVTQLVTHEPRQVIAIYARSAKFHFHLCLQICTIFCFIIIDKFFLLSFSD